jgi:hypothetical protein
MRRFPTAALTLLLSLPIACGGGGGDSAPGTVEGAVEPCNQGAPAFDVWYARFAPNMRRTITAQVNTRDAKTAAEFRLALACQGEIVAEEIGGSICSDDPPQRKDGDRPECPFIAIDVDELDFENDTDGFVECYAEIGITQALDIGTGGCADPTIAGYRLRMEIDAVAIALDIAADNCRDDESCLQSMFGFDSAE